MDANILKYIISTSSVTFDEESANKEWELAKEVDEFPVTKPITIDGLSKTLARLLTFKVSPEAYQRYTVRLELIGLLRDWSRIKWDDDQLAGFQDVEQAFKFFFNVLKKNLSEPIISGCDNVDALVQLAEMLLNYIAKDNLCKKYLKMIVERIICLEQSKKSERFLQYLIENNDKLNLESGFVEKIYIVQKPLFIDKPLENCISEFYLDETNEDNFKKIDFLFEKVIDSPSLFYLISNHLKNVFVKTKYAKESQRFIQQMLERIQTYCDKHNKDTLDLYPANLQFCVLLLRIKPCYHNEKSKRQTVQSLKEIFLEDNNNALLLVSQFPEWLPDYLKFYDILDEPSQRTGTQSNTQITID